MESAEQATSEFTGIMHDLAKPALMRKRIKRKKRKPVPGFDKTCKEIRDHLLYIKNLMERYPYNRQIKRLFYQTRKIFYKQLKVTEDNFKKGILEKLSLMKDNDPSGYWNLLKSLRKSEMDKSVKMTVSHLITG